MTWEQFYKALDEGALGSVCCLYGPEEFIKRSALEALRKKLLPEGLEAMNETILDGASARAIIEAAETLPMMCERRLVIVRDWAPLLPGKSKNEAEETAQMADWIPNAPDTCCTVFYLHGAPDGRKKKLMDLIRKRGGDVIFELLSDAQIAKWVGGQLKPCGKRMEPRAVQAMVFMAGRELTRLHSELQKLAAYAGERELITEPDVQALVVPTLECTVFQMMDRLMGGDKAGAQRLLKTMLESGETRVGVLFMLTRQLRHLTHIKLLKARGMRLPEIEKQLALNHYAAQQAERQAARFSPEALEKGYKACLDAEFLIKSGQRKDALALDSLLLALGEMR